MSALRRPVAAVNLVLAVLVIGGAAWAWSAVRGDATADASETGARAVAAQTGTVTKTVTADGSLVSAATATATFVTESTVTSIGVKAGDRVRKGQVLARADATAAERKLAQAEADRDAADDALDRAEDADADTSAAENAVTQARLAVTEARAAVEGVVLVAPMAGTVTAVNGVLGGSTNGATSAGAEGGSGFIDLADLTKLQVDAAFAEADATQLKAGQAATVTWNALAGATATGKVVSIDPAATTTNDVVTYGVTVSVTGLPDGAKPGQTVSVAVTTGTASNVVLVNSAAVTGAGNRHTVTVLTATGQETRRVEVGLQGDQAYEITSGLAAGERVVLPQTSTTTTTNRQRGGFPGGGFQAPGGAVPGGGRGQAPR